MLCEECGAQSPEGSKFCAACKHALAAPVAITAVDRQASVAPQAEATAASIALRVLAGALLAELALYGLRYAAPVGEQKEI
jgi:hypothetical protein